MGGTEASEESGPRWPHPVRSATSRVKATIGDPANALRMGCARVPARWLRVLFIFMAKPHSSTQQAASVTARFYKEDLGYPISSASLRRPNNLTLPDSPPSCVEPRTPPTNRSP